MFNRSLRVVALTAIALAGITACGGSSSGGEGRVSVALTDAPVDRADEVWLRVTGIAFKAEGSAPEVVESFTPRTLNLLQYQQGDVAVLLDDVPFTAGRYQWLRLIIESEPHVRDSYIVIDGAECELRVPSGAETGLKINRGFTIPADGSLALTIDFDLRQSIHAPPGLATEACATGYLMRPALRLVENREVGAISGTVSFEDGVVPEDCMPKVYLFEGAVTPDDIEETADGADVDPLTIVGVDIPDGAVEGTYRAAFIPAGSYTAAFTCSDDTDEDQSLTFVPGDGAPVEVQANLISTVDFSVPPAAP